MRDTQNPTRFTGINSPKFAVSRAAADATFGPNEPTSSVSTTSNPSSTDSSDASEATETSDDDDNSDSGLSTGAMAGIGVGVGVGVLGLAALAGAFWLVRRKRGADDKSSGSGSGKMDAAQMDDKSNEYGLKNSSGLGYDGAAELVGTAGNRHYEMANTERQRVHELGV